jgi:PAS domain S-box-containing protein
LRVLLEEMIMERRFPGVSFAESQQAFSAVRYILFPTIIEKYQDGDLLAVLNRVNRAIDMIIFHFGDYFRKSHAEKLKSHADKLEEEVQKRTLELDESRRNYQILFEEITDGCFVNQGGRIVFANKAFCDMHAYDREELIGMQCEKLIAEDSRAMVMERFYLHLKGKIPFETYLYCRQDKHGQRFPTENRVKMIKYNGKPAVLGLCTDITERLEMEEKIKQKDRLALIGSLTTSIAHEIRNPLSAIKVNLQILLDKLDLQGNDLRRLQIAHEQSFQLENTVYQMMDFAKPIKLDYGMTSIHEVVDQAIQLLEGKIQKGKVSIVKNLNADLPEIMTDKEKILEAVTNVLRNALEAFNGVGRKREIAFNAETKMLHAKRHLKLSIVDNGIGISPKDKKNIFEPFFTKGKKEGIGLGLSIVKKIIDAHNGRIQIKSEENKGTCFNIMLPVDISQ